MKIDFGYVFLIFSDYILWTLVSLFCGILVSLLSSMDRQTFIAMSLVSVIFAIFQSIPITVMIVIFRKVGLIK